YRTEPGPHWVCVDRLKFGKDAPADQRQELKPGRCDGDHPEYTEAFDIAGLWRATMLAQALGRENDAADWSGLADSLLATYEARFGSRLAKDYGSYAVLWPCRLFPVGEGRAFDQFKNVGMQKPSGWRYSPLATAHQGLLAGNRDAACATLEAHLDHEQMRGWYAFDEGGKSGSGGWRHIRTTWNGDVAMPHGWAIAEFWLLLRDSLLFEDGDHLVLLAGVPEAWLTGKEPIRIQAMPTYFGPCTFTWEAAEGGAKLTLAPGTSPPDGYVLRLPAGLKARVTAGGKPVQATRGTDFRLPAGTTQVEIRFAP
ncbi:MAG: hypothetical protein IMZ65_03520, partial [Planctomycetes bacterium]|nr:hypothetical protein [Planctomycetota bacterium]